LPAPAPEDYLKAFLNRKDATITDLLAQVDKSFGEPLLVVATGSVLEGFGNEESDVDVSIFVDAPTVTDFPVSSHTLGLPLDLNYIDSTWATENSVFVFRNQLHAGPAFSRTEWKRSLRRLTRLGRLCTGAVLTGQGDWLEWQQRLCAAFQEHAVTWWRTEALRQLSAGRLLAPTAPLLAAQRYCDAGLAVLESRAAAAGELYVGSKWIAAKLGRHGAADLLSAFERFMDLPVKAEEAPAYCVDAVSLIRELTAGHPLPVNPQIALSKLPGVQRWEVRGRVLWHRWTLRGAEVDDDSALDFDNEEGLLWQGRLDEVPDIARFIAVQNFAWLSVEEELSA
jgi:hypothetical protein